MRMIKFLILITFVWSLQVNAASMFDALQDKEAENARMCSMFQKKLRQALGEEKVNEKRVVGYQKRVALYCPSEVKGSMFSALQDSETEKARMCKMFQKKVKGLEKEKKLDDAQVAELDSYKKRVTLYCKP